MLTCAPQLSAVGLTSAPADVDRTLVDGLGARRLRGGATAVYEFDNGHLVIGAAAARDGARWLRARLDGVAGAGAVARRPVWARGRRGGIALELRRAPAPAARPTEASVCLDHAALVVGDLDAALAELAPLVGSPLERATRWDFPDLATTGVRVPCDRAYVEIDQPWHDAGLFGAALASDGPSVALVCLRTGDLEAARARLRRSGAALGYVEAVHAHPRGRPGEHRRFGRLTVVSRRSTGGLRLMVLQSDEPFPASRVAAAVAGPASSR